MKREINKWISVETKPEISCRVLICFEEFGLQGTHWCTGTYWHLRDEWTVDSKEYLGMTIAFWRNAESLNIPHPVLDN